MRRLPLVALLLFTPSLALAADLEVGAGQTYAAVQDAVDAAGPGDVILVHDGDYSEDLDLQQNGNAAEHITIQPAPGASPTITGRVTIDGSFWDLIDLTLVARPGARGIRLRGDDNRVLGVEMSGGDRNGIDGGGLRNEVRDCHIHDFDAGQSDAHCIVLNPGAEDWVIAGNDIHDCSGDALQLFSSGVETSITNLLVEDNHMYFTGALQRTENAIDVKNGDGLTIRRNLMHGFPDNKVVVFQKGPINIEMSCNEMFAGFTGVEFRGEDGGTVQNVVFRQNLMHGYSSYALKFDGTDGAEVYNNTFVDIGSDGLRIEGAGLNSGMVRNNLWANTGNVDGGNFDADHNGFFNANNDIGSPTDVMGDPVLDGMFQLDAASPMVDAGVDVGLPFAGMAPDIGWHEVGLDGYGCEVPMGGGGAGAGGAGSGGMIGAGGGGTAAGGGSAAGGSPSSNGAASEDGGCGCATPGGARGDGLALLVVGLAAAATRRRRRDHG